MLVDKAQLLGLFGGSEMTVLVGGMRSMGISQSGLGLFSDNSNKLDNSFFKTLLDMSVEWKPSGKNSY